MTHRRRGATYIGVTSDIVRRVYYEVHATMPLAIQREKNLKKWVQGWKYDLIENVNPHWDDLWEEIVKSPF